MSTDTNDTYAFSADISQLLSLIINTFYTNKEIFLRELISNASDALDKIRYQSLTDKSVLDSEKDLKIEVVCDKNANTISIRDTGIGMTKNELINNLGTIAKSGTKSFMEAVSSGKDISMIGQFGVGFYAAYLVADNVQVYSKNNDDQQYVWESNAGGSFSVKLDDSSERLSRGTRIVLHLKDDMKEYLDTQTIHNLIKKHSEFITFPILLWTEKSREEDVEVENTEEAPSDDVKVEDVTEEKPKTEKKIVKYSEFNHVNSQKPIWMCKKEEVTTEEYKSFYRTIKTDYDYQEFLHVEHFSVEGQVEFNSILFIPEILPYNMFNGERKKNIKLYVRRVFITDDYNLLPSYLSFVVGVIDSEDLPLNISRETLQQNKILTVIKKNLTKRCISIFNDLARDKDKYKKFYDNFSKNIKLGVCEDHNHRDKFIKLLRFKTSKSNGDYVSLEEYVNDMQENQNNIYFIAGESEDSLNNSPFIEKLKSKSYDVLFLTDPMDEYAIQHVREFEGKKLVCAAKEGFLIEQTEDERKIAEESKASLDKLTSVIKDILGESVNKVVVSNRLEISPCVLVTTEYGHTANMERILKSQTLGTNTPMGNTLKIMEINPTHRIINAIKVRMEDNSNSIKDLVWLLYDTALITSGFSLNEPNKFGNRIHKLIELGLDLHEQEESQAVSEVDEMPELEPDTENSMEQVD